MIKEFEFLKIINNTLSSSKYLGDDCAFLKDYGLTVSTDALIEDVHFSTKYMNPYEIATKAMLVNISDILASGAKPKYALITLSGKLNEEFVRNFYQGIEDVSKEYDVKVVGGDLTDADKLSICITFIGDANKRNISFRNNAKEGYIVAVSGEFGSSAYGLEYLQKGVKENYFTKYHKKPVLYPEVSDDIAKNSKYPYAMMDSSDGIFDCLYQISLKSNVKIEVEYDLIPKKTKNRDFVLYGGEDYSLVVALDKEDYKKIKGLTKIGICSEGKGVYIDGKITEYKGFNHFD